MFSLFAGAASTYAGALWFGLPVAGLLGGPTALLGIAGVTASAFIYLVPARPAWNSKHTLASFYLTAAVSGPLFVAAVSRASQVLIMAAIAAAVLQLLNESTRFFWLVRSDEFELRGSARLLSNDLSRLFLTRFALLVVGGILLPAVGWPTWALAATVASEVVSRYLFFVSVVPRNMAASFFARRDAA